jgi:hypothetical protein
MTNWIMRNTLTENPSLPVRVTTNQIWLMEIADDLEHLRRELGTFLRMRTSPEFIDYRDQLTEIIQQIMTILSQERELLNNEK